MNFDFRSWSTGIRCLCDALAALRPQAEAIGAPAPDRDEWYQLLLHKLRPQSFGAPPLVVAVVGGTNIGKSAIFNQLAGEDASSVSPLAAGTKHPVCLCPPGTTDDALLRALFEEFQLRPWSAADDALETADEHLLFWRESRAVPAKLLLLDTPDIDSDAQVNWQRADAVRQTADVLIGVLTQQKYNDAAVKKFFTRAAEADKAVILVFNQIDLALDRDIWPTWLEVFCRDTGIRPVRIYAVPYDRRGAQARGLTFYDIGGDATEGKAPLPVDLGRELADLHYEELKARTLRGALRRVVDPEVGVERYLARVRELSRRFAAARDTLEKEKRLATVWPGMPGQALIAGVLEWWNDRRHPLTRSVYGAYRALGRGVIDLVHLRLPGSTEPVDHWAGYRSDEADAVSKNTDTLLEKLQDYALVADALLGDRLKRLLGGDSRRRMLDEVKRRYAELPPLETQYRAKLAERLDLVERERPTMIANIRHFDNFGAALRPVISLTLLASGFGTGLDFVGVDVIGSSIVGETAATSAVGEGVAEATGFGVRKRVEKFFHDFQTDMALLRANELGKILDDVILGELLAELRRGAEVASGPEMRAATAAADVLRRA